MPSVMPKRDLMDLSRDVRLLGQARRDFRTMNRKTSSTFYYRRARWSPRIGEKTTGIQINVGNGGISTEKK